MSRQLLIDHYTKQRDELLGQIETITNLAMNREDKSLTDQDREQLGVLNDRLTVVNRDLEAAAVRVDLSTQAREAIARVSVGASNVGHAYRPGDEGQAVADVLNRDRDDAAKYRIAQLLPIEEQNDAWITQQNRAAAHIGTSADVTTAPSGGFQGLVVHPVLGPVVSTTPRQTPFLNLLGARNVVASRFFRPRLVDPNIDSGVGPHAGDKEKGELPSQPFSVEQDLVSPKLIGGYLNLSYESIEMIANSAQLVIDQLRLRVALKLERAVAAEAAKTTDKVTLAANADAKAIQAAVWSAMAKVFQNTGQIPTWIVMGPLGQAMLGSSVDLANRPLFPVVGGANALGGADGFSILNPFGLRHAVTPAITDTTMYVGSGELSLEVYLRWLPVLEVPEPSLYGRQIGVAALTSFFHPTTKEAVTGGSAAPAEQNAIVKIGP